jgi:hypothetical protein
MATTYKENRDFTESIMNSDLLDLAIDWIKSNLAPHEVFNESELESWAEDSGYKKETE